MARHFSTCHGISLPAIINPVVKKRALISVYKKDKVIDFAKELVGKHSFEIVSTGGTAKLLKENNIPVIEVNELTKFPEMLEGRVKTLHPAVHAGLLARRDKPEHLEKIKSFDIGLIDLVVINLYPFKEVIQKPKIDLEEAIENIDIGGPSMIRSAAKNYSSVTVVCDVNDYDRVLNSMTANSSSTTLELREQLAVKAFKVTSDYDAAISSFLSEFLVHEKSCNANGNTLNFPDTLNLSLKLKRKLRYGENPHQQAALYVTSNKNFGLANAQVLQGKELSFNNYLDLESAWNIVSEFNEKTPVSVLVKHNNPCGVAIAPSLLHAYLEAFNTDPVSSFGGIVGFNERVEKELASELVKVFLEAIIAPDYSDEALILLKQKPNLRVLKIIPEPITSNQTDLKRIGQGFLVQDFNSLTLDENALKVVTKRKPSQEEMIDLIFAWKVCKHVKSNAIVIAKEGKTIGIGAGQTSRVSSVEIALKHSNYNSKNSCLASDAFFPFKDSIELAASAKITAIIQPGGSIKDQEVIDACNKHDIAMVFTGMRHFKH